QYPNPQQRRQQANDGPASPANPPRHIAVAHSGQDVAHPLADDDDLVVVGYHDFARHEQQLDATGIDIEICARAVRREANVTGRTPQRLERRPVHAKSSEELLHDYDDQRDSEYPEQQCEREKDDALSPQEQRYFALRVKRRPAGPQREDQRQYALERVVSA